MADRPDTSDVVRRAAEREGVSVDEVVEVRPGTGEVVHAGGDDPDERAEAIERAGERVDGSPESVVHGRPTAVGHPNGNVMP